MKVPFFCAKISQKVSLRKKNKDFLEKSAKKFAITRNYV